MPNIQITVRGRTWIWIKSFSSEHPPFFKQEKEKKLLHRHTCMHMCCVYLKTRHEKFYRRWQRCKKMVQISFFHFWKKEIYLYWEPFGHFTQVERQAGLDNTNIKALKVVLLYFDITFKVLTKCKCANKHPPAGYRAPWTKSRIYI